MTKIAITIEEIANYLSKEQALDLVQLQLDKMIEKINKLQQEFHENDSEIETFARDAIFEVVEKMLIHFNINIDTEEALRKRDW